MSVDWSEGVRRLAMSDLLDRYDALCIWTDKERPNHASIQQDRDAVRVEIERRHVAAIEAGGSEVRYALEGDS